ncbi:MAG: hypothetical protein RQ739_12225 [Desulfotignum sp.]|nr:hypothetical protein [Desulfotignum sp.]
MDINDLFEGIAEAFRQYQVEMAEQGHGSSNPNPTGLGPNAEAEKTEKKVATEKREEEDFPKTDLLQSI